MNIQKLYGKVRVGLRRLGPSIATGFSIGTGVAATYEASKAAIEVHDEKEERQEKLAKVRETGDPKALAKAYISNALHITGKFVPYLAFQALSTGSLLWGHNRMHTDLSGMTSAYSMLAASVATMQQRIADKYGEDALKDICEDVQEVTVSKMDENGGVTTEVVRTTGQPIGKYTFVFGPDTTTEWYHKAEYVIEFLWATQRMLNARFTDPFGPHLMSVNDRLDALGAVGSRSGVVLGNIYDPDDPTRENCIDLGIFDAYGNLLPGVEIHDGEPVTLTFNIDGLIIDDCVKLNLLSDE